MAAVQRGETAALDVLFMRYHGRLFSFLERWTGDSHAAEDLVQETFLRLLRQPDGFVQEGSALPLLYRMGRNLAIDRHRRQRIEISVDAEDSLADERPLPLDRLTTEERHRQLEDALAALPLAHREVLLLRGVDGLGHREIAVVLSCTEAAARVRLHRATAALRHIWHARNGGD